MNATEVSTIIRQRVQDRTYSYRIPATRELAEGFSIGRDTARRAVNILQEEGLLICTGRKIFVKSVWEARTSAVRPAPHCPALVTPVTADDLRRAIRQPNAQFMTPEEFAKFTRLSKMTVYRLIHDRELGATRMGDRCFRIPIDSAVEFLKESSSWS
jgi:excisionase family DNA binding protein